MNKDQYDKKLNEHQLRGVAEGHLTKGQQSNVTAQPAEELLYELRVHQIELEMQNEALRQTQQALEESRDRYVDLYELAPIGYLTLNVDGIIVEINLTGVTLLGQERSKLINKSLRTLVAVEDRDKWVRNFMAIKNQTGKGRIELSLLRGDATIFQALVDCVGDQSEFRITLTDISEHKRVENRLRIAATAFEAQEGIIVTDVQGIIIRVNQAFTKLTGYSEEEVVGQPVTMLKSGAHDASFYQSMWAQLNRDGRWLGELMDKRKNGEVFPARMLISSVKNPEGITTHYVGSFLDNTLQKQTETALVEAKAAADKANLSKSRFLAAASHDLRQPLAALSLYVDLLMKKDLSDNGSLSIKIQGCVNSLSELLNDLLDVSKLDAGVVVPKPSDFPINELLQAMVTMHSPEATLKGLRLRVRPSNWIGRTDFQMMQRILGNLVFNAIRYTNKGGILLGCRHYQGKQWIEVWDTGIGIPENKLDSIFEEFTQLADSRNRGSGLGLAIVNKSANLLGLEVRVRSRLGHGSMFAIEIPQGQIIPIEYIPKAKPPSISLKIGLVDDNANVLEAFTFALNSFGYEVIAATSGKELFEQLGNHHPDILITDYRLADSKNGLDLVAEARRLFTYNLPAIIITGDTDTELLSRMAKYGVTVCHKPLKIDALEAAIQELVTHKEA